MSKTSTVSKIKLTSYDDLFGSSLSTGANQIQQIPLADLHEFKDHPFKVMDDEKMQETVESIKEHGILIPGIVRPRKSGGYEIISGHRRKHASELLGLTTMPVIVRDYTDDEATIIMVDSNIQRENILPSEKAFAYKMKLEAMKHQGKAGKASAAHVGEAAGDNAKTVQRYIRLTYLIPEFLQMVDDSTLPLMCGVDLSFLSLDVQMVVYQTITQHHIKLTLKLTGQLREKENLTGKEIEEILFGIPSTPPSKRSIKLPQKTLDNYFTPDYTEKQIQDILISLLDRWKSEQG